MREHLELIESLLWQAAIEAGGYEGLKDRSSVYRRAFDTLRAEWRKPDGIPLCVGLVQYFKKELAASPVQESEP